MRICAYAVGLLHCCGHHVIAFVEVALLKSRALRLMAVQGTNSSVHAHTYDLPPSEWIKVTLGKMRIQDRARQKSNFMVCTEQFIICQSMFHSMRRYCDARGNV